MNESYASAAADDDNDVWSDLSTIATVDQGNDSWKLERIEASRCRPRAIGRVDTSTSLLIESLLTLICSMWENEPALKNKLYRAYCDLLFDMNLINKSYIQPEFDTLRGQHQKALFGLLMVAKQAIGSDDIVKLPDPRIMMSDYLIQFDEIGFIASGGFGSVYRARNKVDGNEYAIKKITVRSGRVKSIIKHLKEVKILAKFNHTNIVAYKGAWIEKNLPTFVRHDYYTYSQNKLTSSQDDSCQDSTNNENSSNNIKQNSISNKSNSINYNINKNNKTGKKIKDQSSASISNNKDEELEELELEELEELEEEEAEEEEDEDDDISFRDSSSDLVSFRASIDNNKKNVKEEEEAEDEDDDDISFRDNSSSDLVSFKASTDNNKKIVKEEEAEEEEDDDIISFRYHSSDIINNSSVESPSNNNETSETSETGSSNDQSPTSQNHVTRYNSSKRDSFATLYIQMALCEETLREWMDKRQEPTPISFIIEISKQTLEGLHYMHSLGAVHHDIKPSNIFIDTSGSLRIQLGDFGLTCPLQRESHPAMGTQVYAAPEQLQGQCDPKSDVYSFGIIFFELLFPMSTAMERSQLIGQAKEGKFSDSHYQQYPEWCELIKRLIEKDPKKRPSTKSLLHELTPDISKKNDTEIEKLKKENNKLKVQNKELNDELTKLKNELEQLKLKLL